jgi:DNA-binding transcriptional ArsR family regulator
MLKDLLVSEVRVNILKTMLRNPSKPFHVRALVRAVDTEINAVRRELLRLTNLGLLRNRQSGNRIYYSVNTSSIYFAELLSMVSKEEGLGADIIKHAKQLGDIRYAVLSRAFLRGRESSVLDVDLFIVGTVNIEVLQKLVREEEARIGREINYTVMSEEDFVFRKRRNDQFMSKVLAQSRTMLLGDEEEFCNI